MILSNDFINTEVNATGRKSLHSLEHGFLGSGMMCEVFQAVGKVCVSSECWNMGCHTGASSCVCLQNRGTDVVRAGGLACIEMSKNISHLTH